MMSTSEAYDTASSVAPVNKGCVQELGRGSCSKNSLQSPVAHGKPSGEPSANTAALQSTSKAGEASKGAGPSSVGVSGPQRHTGDSVSGATGLSKSRRKKLRKVRAMAASGRAKRPRSSEATLSPNVPTQKEKKPRKDVVPGRIAQSSGVVPPSGDSRAGEGVSTGGLQSGVSFACATKSTKIAIVLEDFPRDKLSLEDSNIILKEILVQTDAIPCGERLPEIYSNHLQKGALVLQCNEFTVGWINCHFNGKALGNLMLKVISADELPRPVEVAFKTREQFSDQGTFLWRLQRLNPGLKSMGWRVLQSAAEPGPSRWIFEVEPEDVETIARANFCALTGVDRGVFKIIHDPNRKKSS
nr:uncharacterized protein LOC107445940 [Parasteatoda tepidariorum]